MSTRRVEKLVEQLSVKQLSKSQVSQMAAHLDVQVEAFRNRPLDSGHYAFVWMDALTIKVREAGRTVNVHDLVAVGVNADGGREVLGLDVASDEDGAGWLAFRRSLTARGLSSPGAPRAAQRTERPADRGRPPLSRILGLRLVVDAGARPGGHCCRTWQWWVTSMVVV